MSIEWKLELQCSGLAVYPWCSYAPGPGTNLVASILLKRLPVMKLLAFELLKNSESTAEAIKTITSD